jgi:hypothetical protein
MLEAHLKQLSSQFSFPLDFEKDGEGYYQLMIDSSTTISIKELPKGFICKSPVAALPAVEQEDLLALLMRANYLGQGTKGGVLALNETGQTIVFFSSLVHEYNFREFKEKIEEFVNYLNYWKTRIKDEATKR